MPGWSGVVIWGLPRPQRTRRSPAAARSPAPRPAPRARSNHRGLRHYWGLTVKGQHTKTTGRRGKTVGVSKKK